ncbi:peptidoglycan recognition protein family protein [Rhodococcus spongiicola]|uniref:N-acetylmuramoyl-L-alanine amidase n=1 Tax=Rhodococcus spongiicola TaxID=2487352 RepID=A0A438B746_9NOCA|nr:N-acetylmuramoyl-L-alanine amidase [Rhodococcus spongiicola]RVW06793.1 hypothetical protein EF834_03695 [Rhodococcus spongiicola]
MMAWTGDPVWLEEVIGDAGVSVTVYPGAWNRGHGDMGTVWGVMVHHTGAPAGSNPGPGVIAEHPSLGLASQVHLSRDGEATVCGVGVAWHAGEGSWPGIMQNNANEVTIGIEAENSGTEGWSPVQYEAYVKMCAAICRRLGVGSARVIGHKEWAGAAQGKWDPGGLDMDKFRADIQDHIDHDGTPPGTAGNEIDRIHSFSGWLGERLHAGERTCKDGVGGYADFEHGSIYWHPDIGAVPVPALVYQVWARRRWEQGPLGYPTRYHVVVPGQGDIQEFQGGIVARRYGTAGYRVHGAIGARWRAEGDVRVDRGSRLGWPTSDEYDHDGGRRQDFEHGSLVWRADGVISIEGDK